ncbi:hypothetical protein BH23ACI1_BH23ACI1_32150 [soil metagenome]
MNGGFEERRRSPRLELASAPELRLNRRVVVRLVDISESGALVASDEHLPVGTTGQLRLALGGQPFQASVQVRRDQVGQDRAILLGTTIAPEGHSSQDVLEQFLRRSLD